MNEFITLSTQLHLLFVIVLIILIGLNLYLLKKDTAFIKLSKKIELIAPQYYIVLSAIFFTGIIVMAVTQFTFHLSVWVMIFVWFFILFFGIKGHRRYKKMDKKDEVSQGGYKTFALKKYTVDLALILATTLFAYLVH